MTKEIRSKLEEEIKFLKKMTDKPDLGLTMNQFNHRLVGMLNGLLFAGAITDEERFDLYRQYKMSGKDMAGYTEYCTTFYVPEEKKVYFWDEIKDKLIKKQKVADKEEADHVMRIWQGNAPAGVICDIL